MWLRFSRYLRDFRTIMRAGRPDLHPEIPEIHNFPSETRVFGVTPFFACDGRFYGGIGTSTVACSLAFGAYLSVAGLSEGTLGPFC